MLRAQPLPQPRGGRAGLDHDVVPGVRRLRAGGHARPEESDAPAVEAAADVFRTWEALLATALQENGVAATRARRLATLVVAAVEGAVAICRADRSTRAPTTSRSSSTPSSPPPRPGATNSRSSPHGRGGRIG